jgi:aerobic-type carbon monoxide dehydrogenase small subunit (CoxS/CutS family)
MQMSDKSDQKKDPIVLTVNDVTHELEIGDHRYQVAASEKLAHTLRETLGLSGAKVGCNQGACGSCTVLLDGIPILSCMTLTVECDGRQVTTIEGLQDPATGELDEIQQVFIDYGAFQCGFCTPGIILASRALLNRNPSPTEADIKGALAGHYCRCISHYQVIEALQTLTEKKKNETRE